MSEGPEKYTPGKKGGGGQPPEDDEWTTVASADFDGDFDAALGWKALNDLGNAERLIARFGEDMIYVQDVGWHVWDGVRWDRIDGERQAHLFAQKTAAAVRDEARAIKEAKPDRAEALFKFAKSAGETGKIAAMQREARPHLTRSGEDMDRPKYLFNVANGTLELGEEIVFREHRRADLLTRRSPVEYDPDAECPQFKEFLNDILPQDLQDFLRVWKGYNLTGDISEQVLVLLTGTGSNGKSVFMAVPQYVQGDYALTLPFQSLLHNDRRGGGDATPDLAQLPGARAVSAAEPDAGARFSESILKSMTGGEKMSVRHLREGFFEFYPQFKLTLSFNNRPSIRDQSEGIWRRLLMVPFKASITGDDIDKHLTEKIIAAEGPGVLNWILSGCMEWFKNGLVVPEAVKKATGDYRSDSDPVGNFLAELTVEDRNGTVQASILYAAYETWCKTDNIEAKSATLFGRILTDKGFRKERVGVVFYYGIRILKEKLAVLEGSGGSGGFGPDVGDPGAGVEDIH